MSYRRVILWDFDGTLVSRPFMWSEAVLAALSDVLPGHEMTEEKVRRQLSAGFPWHTPMVPHPELNQGDAWWSKVSEAYAPLFQGVGGGVQRDLKEAVRSRIIDARYYRVFDDVVPTITALSEKGWGHAILSNHIPELPDLVDRLDLGSHFEFVLSSGATGYEKPHPEAFRMARRLLVDADQLFMVGDSPTADVAGAEQAGMDPILVRTRSSDVRYQTDDLYGLPMLLDSYR